jgi:hypothetical protein
MVMSPWRFSPSFYPSLHFRMILVATIWSSFSWIFGENDNVDDGGKP